MLPRKPLAAPLMTLNTAKNKNKKVHEKRNNRTIEDADGVACAEGELVCLFGSKVKLGRNRSRH